MSAPTAQYLLAYNQTRRTRTTVLRLRRRGDPVHGTMAAYQRGCGCDVCRAANRVATRAKRQRETYREDA